LQQQISKYDYLPLYKNNIRQQLFINENHIEIAELWLRGMANKFVPPFDRCNRSTSASLPRAATGRWGLRLLTYVSLRMSMRQAAVFFSQEKQRPRRPAMGNFGLMPDWSSLPGGIITANESDDPLPAGYFSSWMITSIELRCTFTNPPARICSPEEQS
jgi:hypothetical protein